MALSEIGLPAIIRPSFTMGRHRRRHRLQSRRISRHHRARPRRIADQRSADRGIGARLERVRDGGCPATKMTTASSCARSRTSIRWACITGDSITVAPPSPSRIKSTRSCATPHWRCCARSAWRPADRTCSSASIPADGRMVVIEMNPRVSRSSALASKATGFPIAKESPPSSRSATRWTKSPTISPAARHLPRRADHRLRGHENSRFAFEKFPGASTTLTTSMKSVGEVMAIGRTFQESLQKALRGLETGLTGLDEIEIEGLGQGDDKNAVRAALGTPTRTGCFRSLRQCGSAGRMRTSSPPARSIRGFSPKCAASWRWKPRSRAHGLPGNAHSMRTLKAMGFLRRAPRGARRPDRSRGKVAAADHECASGVQAHRYLRGGVRLAHRLYVFDLMKRRSQARPPTKVRRPTRTRS